jgi:hypothetical protein
MNLNTISLPNKHIHDYGLMDAHHAQEESQCFFFLGFSLLKVWRNLTKTIRQIYSKNLGY